MSRLEECRLRRGWSLAEAAKKVGVSPAYLRRLERGRVVTYSLALRLSRVYGLGIGDFLNTRRASEARDSS